jgi:uncharacterized protein HemY
MMGLTFAMAEAKARRTEEMIKQTELARLRAEALEGVMEQAGAEAEQSALDDVHPASDPVGEDWTWRDEVRFCRRMVRCHGNDNVPRNSVPGYLECQALQARGRLRAGLAATKAWVQAGDWSMAERVLDEVLLQVDQPSQRREDR